MSSLYQDAWELLEKEFIKRSDAPALEAMEQCLKEARQRVKETQKELAEKHKEI